ncbi:MAG: hypothetical protein U9Q81_26995 [Pseudomonadota bacterium]|nr:hypothetical protein [Pseudomonadota bacterium]
MKWAPWSSRIRQTPAAYWRRGYRIQVFCGRHAWRDAGRFVEAGGILKARERTTLVLLPGENPAALRWPVRHRVVWVVDTGGTDVDGLCAALVRDGVRDVTLYTIGRERAASWGLSLSQPVPRFDPGVIAAARQAEQGVMINLLVRGAQGTGGERVKALIREFAADGIKTAQVALTRLDDDG